MPWSAAGPRGYRARASSAAAGTRPERAIDGNAAPALASGSCMHTAEEPMPWWALDLGASMTVTGLALTPRTDACCAGEGAARNTRRQ